MRKETKEEEKRQKKGKGRLLGEGRILGTIRYARVCGLFLKSSIEGRYVNNFTLVSFSPFPLSNSIYKSDRFVNSQAIAHYEFRKKRNLILTKFDI